MLMDSRRRSVLPTAVGCCLLALMLCATWPSSTVAQSAAPGKTASGKTASGKTASGKEVASAEPAAEPPESPAARPFAALSSLGQGSGERPDADQRPAAVDSSRAQTWRSMRQAKAQTMEPFTPSLVGRTVAFLERNRSRVLPDRLVLDVPTLDLYGVQPVLGGLSGEAGATAGLFYEVPFRSTRGLYAHTQALASARRYWGVEAIGGLHRGRWHGYGFARFTHRAAESFYGIGPDTDLDRRSFYRLNEGLGGVLAGYSATNSLFVGGYAAYRTDRTGKARYADGPSVSNTFEASPPVGYFADVDHVITGVFAELDARDATYDREYGRRFAPTSPGLRGISLDATRGYYLAASLTHHQDVVDRDFSYARATLDAQQYIPLKHGMQRGLAFRQYLSVSESPARQQVPFHRMPSIGGARSLRGFTGGRFRARNVFLATAEMRSHIWHRLDMALFTDAGQVFNRFGEAHIEDLMVGYGIGFRFRSQQGVVARFEVARSVEGFSTYLKFGSIL